MKKLVVINSFGPMGSTLLSGLVEKLGFTNIPLRKTNLHRYLLGQLTLDSGHMQKRVEGSIREHAKPAMRGGVSVLDRDNQKASSLLTLPDNWAGLGDLQGESVEDLYFRCRKSYCAAVTYKKIESNLDWQIELTTDIHRYDHKALYQAYQDHFEDVRMIHLRRPFAGWINSLASQAFVHPQFMPRIKFFPHMRYADYALYEEAIAAMPGLDIVFDDMFDIPVDELSAKIAEFLDVDPPKEDFKTAVFDLYGKSTHYDVAFKRFDDGIDFLRPSTRDFFEKLANTGKMKNLLFAFLAWLRYLGDLCLYHLKNKKK